MKYLLALIALGVLAALVSITGTVLHLTTGGAFRPRDAAFLVVDVALIAYLAWWAKEVRRKQ